MSESTGEALRQAFARAADGEAASDDATAEESVRILSFALADEWYGFRLRDLVEIIGGVEPTPIPYTPDFLPGLINHRGSVVGVIDLKRVFGLTGRFRRETGRIVLVRRDDVVVGFQADEISDIVSVPQSGIEAPLSTMERVKAEYMEGCIRLDRGLLVLLDSRTLIHELRPHGSSE
jgi:purine-binding chemotaxis protein CheW